MWLYGLAVIVFALGNMIHARRFDVVSGILAFVGVVLFVAAI